MGMTKKKPVRRVSINRRVGLPKPRVFYGKTKAEAERKYQQAVQDYQLECLSPKERRYTYRQIATAYEDYITGPLHPIRKGTVNAYRLHIKPTREYFGDTVMNDIDAQAVRGYLERMKVAGKSKHTMQMRGASSPASFPIGARSTTAPTIRRCWLSCLRDAVWPSERTHRRTAQAHQRPLRGLRLLGVAVRVYGAADGRGQRPALAGCGPGCGYDHPDAGDAWYKNQPYKEKLKTENAYRSIPILSPLRPLLEAGKAAHRPEDYVMSGADTPLTQCQYRRRWVVYCRQLGLCESYMAKYKVPATSLTPAHTAERLEYKPLVTAHQFRHLFATNLFYAASRTWWPSGFWATLTS